MDGATDREVILGIEYPGMGVEGCRDGGGGMQRLSEYDITEFSVQEEYIVKLSVSNLHSL